MSQPAAGWMFLTKANPENTKDWDSVTYPVAYFDNGMPWIATPASSVLRKPTAAEHFWGVLVSPGQSQATAWNRAKARGREEAARVTDWLVEYLTYHTDGQGKVLREDLRAYADEIFNPAAVTAALSGPEFLLCAGDHSSQMFWALSGRN